MKRIGTIIFFNLIIGTLFVSGQSVQSDSLFSLGISYYKNEQYDEAIKYFAYCDSLDTNNDKIGDERKAYSKMWIASCYYKIGKDSIAMDYSPKYYKYPPIDRSKTARSDSLSNVATSFFKNEDFEKALEVLITCAKLEKNSLGAYSLWYKNTITECGYLCYNMGKYEDAIKYGIISKDISLKVCGRNSDEHIESLINLINYYGEINDYETVNKYLKELESIRNEIVYDDNCRYADALMELAGYYEILDEYDEAVRLITKANDVAGKDPEARSVRNFLLFEDLIHLRQFDKAIVVGQESIRSFEERISPSDSTYSVLGILYTRLADCYSNTGNYIKAVELCQQAVRIFDISQDSDDSKTSTLNVLASCYNELGLYEDALKSESAVIDIMKSMKECDSLKYAIALSNLAFYHSKLGNKVDAYILCEEAYNIVQRLEVSMENPDLLLILSNLASHYADIGNYSKAVELNKLVVSIRSKTVGKDTFEYATSLNNLATYLSYLECYDIEEVISLQKESVDIIESVYGKNNSFYIESLSNLAVLYDNCEYPQVSLELFNQALSLTDSLYNDKDHPSKIIIYYNIANIYNGLKQYDMAIKNLKKAYSIMMRYGMEESPEYIKIEKGLYYSYLRSNDIAEAKDWMRKTYKSVYDQVVESFPRLSSNERELFWNQYSEWFYEDLPQLIYYDSSVETAKTLYNSCLLSKGILLSTNIQVDKLLKDENPSLLIELQRIRQAQKLLEMEELSDSIFLIKETAERQLINNSQVYKGLQNYYKLSYKEVLNALNDHDLAVEFFSIPSDSGEVYYALCLKKSYDGPHVIRICDTSQLPLSVNYEMGFLDSLFICMWEPIKEELVDVENIFFAPYGKIHSIGIEYASGMEKYNIYRLSSTRELIDINENNKSDRINDLSSILYGGIDYENQIEVDSGFSSEYKTAKDSNCDLAIIQHRAFVDSLDLRGMTINYLPGTLKEVNNIKSSLEEKKYFAKTITGSKATETSVKSLSGHCPKILHIATHSFYFSEKRAKKNSKLLFLAPSSNSNEEDKALTRSGLLFAGVKNYLHGKEVPMGLDDGILTAQEIANIDFRGIELVVLSGCETGTGDIIYGEGVFGLQRGFKKAGIGSILMSLWKVSDIPTEMLMTEFYKSLCEGRSKRESLKFAQKKVREFKDTDGTLLFKEPYYCAGFIILD